MDVPQLDKMSGWKQNTGGDTYQIYKARTSPKSRSTASSPKYVRTWSQQEESFLLEARKLRIPYKEIATRLNKTDLACRLHYHQMVVTKKNSSVEDDTPVPGLTPEQYPTVFQYYSRSESLPPVSNAVSHKTMLPPDHIGKDSVRSGSGLAMLSPNHRRATSHPLTPDRRSPSFSPANGIHKHISTMSGKGHNVVDIDRIQELYRDFAPSFWSNIAAAYSHERPLSPSEIESAFWQGQCFFRSQPLSPNSDTRSTSPTSWPSANSTASSMASQASDDEPPNFVISPRSIVSNRTRCSVNAILNN